MRLQQTFHQSSHTSGCALVRMQKRGRSHCCSLMCWHRFSQVQGLVHRGHHVGHTPRRARCFGLLGSFRKIEGVRPHHQRAGARCGFDQVLTTQRLKTPPQQSHIGQAVLQRHLAQTVAQPDLGMGLLGRPGNAPMAATQHAQAC